MLPRIALFLTSALWGLSFVYTKEYLHVLNPITFTAYSFLISGFFFLLLSFLQGKRFSFRLREGVILGVMLFLLELPQTIGLSETTAANTVFITHLGILFMPILAWVLYNHKVKISTFVALAIALYGMYLLTGGVQRFNQGDAWVIISAFGCLFYYTFSDHFEKQRKSDTIVLCAQQFLVIGGLSLFVAIISRAPLLLQSTDASWMPLVTLTIFFTLIPYLLLQWAERTADEVKVTFYTILEPLIGGIAAWTIGAEIATPAMIVGGGLIVISLIISEYYRFKVS